MRPLQELSVDLGSDPAVGDPTLNAHSDNGSAPLSCPAVQDDLYLSLIREALAELLKNLGLSARDDEEVASQFSSPASACRNGYFDEAPQFDTRSHCTVMAA